MVACLMDRTFLAVQARGLVAIPPAVRKRLGLDRPGAQVEMVVRDDGVLELHPHLPMPVIALDAVDSAFVADLLLNPPEPNEKLRRALEAHDRLISR